MTKPTRAHNDLVLSMCGLWQSDCDRLEAAASLASKCERAMLDATADAKKDAARAFRDAARVRDALADKLEMQARAIFRTKAKSLQGVAAKLAVALRENQPSPDDATPPWPDLRSVERDLTLLIAELA
ncbi:hypothetical protein [Roseiterribacter gracilis]